ncbi:MAG: ATP-binding cassette domain-containing protein, partial [Chloroflexi bacterium]|nr:ATP-binding cassette domain-containing protein [Chloroflexota bacterium]
MSGGEKQRLALAAVLALRPRILLLDEPTADLDADGTAQLYATIERLPRDTTIVLVEHRVAQAVRLVDRVIAVDAERGVIADGPPADVFRRAADELERAGIWTPDAVVPAAPQAAKGRTLLTARGAGFRYPGSTQDALSPATSAVREGEALAVEGPNGSGKSTLLLLLAGLLRPSTGSVTAPVLDPERPDVARWPAHVLASRIAMV